MFAIDQRENVHISHKNECKAVKVLMTRSSDNSRILHTNHWRVSCTNSFGSWDRYKTTKPSFTRPWDYMILTALNGHFPKVPMYKNSETNCIPSPKYI